MEHLFGLLVGLPVQLQLMRFNEFLLNDLIAAKAYVAFNSGDFARIKSCVVNAPLAPQKIKGISVGNPTSHKKTTIFASQQISQ